VAPRVGRITRCDLPLGRGETPAAGERYSSPHAPERTARSPALCEAVCALSPLELMAHLHALPMEDANLHPTSAMLTPFTSSRMLNA